MENASKALIIAGAILLSILIISLGIVVVRNAQGTINNANLNTEEIQAFNGRFDQYCGTGKSNAQINALVTAVAASNGAQSKLGEPHYINITIDSSVPSTYYTGSSVSSMGSQLTYPSFSAGRTYTATPTTGADGYIHTITIK